jgi:hypothetical protein
MTTTLLSKGKSYKLPSWNHREKFEPRSQSTTAKVARKDELSYILLSPSLLLILILFLYPTVIRFVWTPCTLESNFNSTITDKTRNQCCNLGLQIVSLLATIILLLCFLIFVVASRCCITEHCFCSKMTKRKYNDIGIGNVIGYLLYFCAWLFYFPGDVLIFCHNWTLEGTRIAFICFFTVSLFFLTCTNLFLLSLFSEKDKYDLEHASEQQV